MSPRDMAIHVVVLCALLVALISVAVGYTGEASYVDTLLLATIVCLLAGILFVLERRLK